VPDSGQDDWRGGVADAGQLDGGQQPTVPVKAVGGQLTERLKRKRSVNRLWSPFSLTPFSAVLQRF
jgi:hypothetical protein